MLAFLLWVGLSATVLLLLAAAADEFVARSRSSRPSTQQSGIGTLVSISLVRAGAARVRSATEVSSQGKKAA